MERIRLFIDRIINRINLFTDRIRLFVNLLIQKAPADCLRNACRYHLGRSWRYSKLASGLQIRSLFYCVLCSGVGTIFGNRCPRCEGSGTVEFLNPDLFALLNDNLLSGLEKFSDPNVELKIKFK